MGPSYCDCRDGNCKIVDESILEATRIGIHMTDENKPQCQSLILQRPNEDEHTPKSSYIRDFYHIPLLKDPAVRNRLIQQAKELVQHSRDTFWLDAVLVCDRNKRNDLCDLELLAWNLFHRHWEHYASGSNHRKISPRMIRGAEWWVQVKPVTQQLLSKEKSPTDSLNYDTFVEEAIDLHYDKDEEMAISFGLGVFPSLSTVTYFTENASPTLIFPRRYEDQDDGTMSEMFISHPLCNKHLVFDGRLLHGAPSHPLLRRQMDDSIYDDARVSPMERITFLVNIWLDYKPAHVNPLPHTIRESIQIAASGSKSAPMISLLEEKPLEIVPVDAVPILFLTSLEDQPELLREKIELPFVGGKSTWATDGDDMAMIVKVYPPPPSHHDAALIQFGPGLEATFEYSGASDEESNAE